MRGQLKQAGFTLAEVLIIAPVVILVIGSFIVFIVNITGETLKTKASIDALSERQTALNFIQNDIRLSSGFVDTITAPTTPQGSDNATADWTNSGATTADESLILTRYATDINPIDQDSVFIYRDTPNSCASNENQLYTYYSVYFLETATKTLWQRNVMPDYPTILADLCADPWQLPSCAESVIAANPTICKTEDVEVAKNVEGFDIRYLDGSGAETSNRSDTESIEIVIETSKAVAGQTITSSSTLRTSKRDGAGDPTNQYNIGWTFPYSTPTTPSFYWSAVSGADNYDVRYKVNGGNWSGISNVAGGATTHSYNGAEVFRDDTVTIEVTAKQGSTPITTVSEATATIPKWTECEMQNGWLDYSTGFGGAEFTKTSRGVVMLRGLVKSGTMSASICNLPAGFRPSGQLWFQNYSNNAVGRLDITASGNVMPYHGNNTWVSLSGATFLVHPTTGACDTWKSPSLINGWGNYGNGFPAFRATKDCIGRVFLEGLLTQGTNTTNTTISDLSASPLGTSYRPGIHTHFATGSYAGGTYISNALHLLDSGPLQARGTAAVYQATQLMYYPTGLGSWTSFPLSSPFTAYSAYYTPHYTKAADDIVSLRGLVSANAGYCPGTIGTLPAGYRPSKRMIFNTMHGANYAVRIDILTDGQVYCNGTISAATYVSLNEISFIADN